jgi:hypothetical protein
MRIDDCISQFSCCCENCEIQVRTQSFLGIQRKKNIFFVFADKYSDDYQDSEQCDWHVASEQNIWKICIQCWGITYTTEYCKLHGTSSMLLVHILFLWWWNYIVFAVRMLLSKPRVRDLISLCRWTYCYSFGMLVSASRHSFQFQAVQLDVGMLMFYVRCYLTCLLSIKQSFTWFLFVCRNRFYEN